MRDPFESREPQPGRATRVQPYVPVHPGPRAGTFTPDEPPAPQQASPLPVVIRRGAVGDGLMVLFVIGFFVQTVAAGVFLVAAWTVWRALSDLRDAITVVGGLGG